MNAKTLPTRRLLVVCHHRDRQTAHFEGAKSCVHYYSQKCNRRRTTKAEARARASPQSSNPFTDALPYPTIEPSRKEWKKTFTTNDGVKYTCRACDVDDIPAVASLLMRSKLAGFPTEESKLKKYIEKSINAFPRGAYIVLVKDDDEEEEKSKKCVGVVGVSNTPETRRDDFDRALQFTDDGGYISDLVIDTRWRGRGLGEKLMLCGESLCKEMGREEVYLHVSTRKVGVIRLYENIGYEERSSNFLRRDLLMRKKI